MNLESTPCSTLRPIACCSCPAVNSRCATAACPCHSANQKCRVNCGVETTTTITTPFIGGDFCLNRPAVVCRCERPRKKSPTMTIAADNFKPTTKTTTAASATTYQRFLGDEENDFFEDVDDRWSLKSADMSITETDLKRGGEIFYGQSGDDEEPGLGAEKADTAKKGSQQRRDACSNRQCDCFKFRERCTDECRCKGDCTNNVAPKIVPFGERPQMSCKCKGGKSKSCLKDEKCPCRQLLNYCSKSCKCKCDCANSAKNASRLSKNAKLCLISPEQPASFGLARLTSEIYDYQFGYCSADKFSAAALDDKHVEEAIYHKIMTILNHYQVPLRKIEIYVSKSPCYHQYCRPECGTLSTCHDNKCCAETLAVMARQMRRRLKDATLEVSVKILMVDGSRGDLYTTKSLSTMLKGGINVEPLCMKEWSQFIFDKQPLCQETGKNKDSQEHLIEDFCSQPMDFEQLRSLTVDAEHRNHRYAQVVTSSFHFLAKNTWSVCQMDTYLLQTQQYINKSRTSLGLKKSYWCSRLHELLKNSVRSTYESRQLFQDLESKLEKLTRRRHHFRSTMTLLSSLIGLGVSGGDDGRESPPKNCNIASVEISPILAKNRPLKEAEVLDKSSSMIDQHQQGCKTPPHSSKKYVKRSNTGPLIALSKQLSIFRNKSTSNTILNDQIIAKWDDQPAAKTPSMANENKQASIDSKRDIDRLILAISSRNITEEEKSGIIKEISECVEDIKMRLDFFMDLLEMKITSTSI
uniref:CRC domain-containing protein n=1 Tax=Romanomermis culicivorax TaxID=13658 RepID=A0A915IVA3_ROMCU